MRRRKVLMYGVPPDHPDYKKLRNRKKKANGVCTNCHVRPAEKDKVRCKICLDKRRANTLLLKQEIMNAYGGKCNCCGESELHFLAIDHIFNDGCKERRLRGDSIYLWLKKNGFPTDRYQVLCHNCNMGKKLNNGTCPHQTRGINDRTYRSTI